MPIYEYECKYCEYIFEVHQSIKARRKRKCPECNRRNALNRLVGATNFALKGKGWAKDGYSKSASDNTKKEKTNGE